MMSLEYFLDGKSLNKILRSLENGIYNSKIPKSFENKFCYNLADCIESDRYLFNYLGAYGNSKIAASGDEMKFLDLAALLILDADFQDIAPKQIKQTIVEMISGRRPVNKSEKLIWNVVEAFNLVQQEKFEINEDNYELFIHIIFRNIGFDLDSKKNYYRNEKDKTILKETVSTESIDKELLCLFEYIKDLKEQRLGGFTQAYIIATAFLTISPYKKYNLIVGILLSQWYLNQTNANFRTIFPIYSMGNNWKNIIKKINDSYRNDLDLTDVLKAFSEYTKFETNIAHRLFLLETWIAEDYEKRNVIFSSMFSKLIVVSILGKREKEVTFIKIKQDFAISEFSILEDNDLQKFIDELVVNGILRESRLLSGKYSLNDKTLYKYKMILKD